MWGWRALNSIRSRSEKSGPHRASATPPSRGDGAGSPMTSWCSTSIFRKIDVEHQLVIGLPAPSPRLGGVALARCGPDFSERDRILLSALQPHIVKAHWNAESFSRVKREATLVLAGLEEIGRGIVLLEPDGGIRLATRLARQWLTTYFGQSALLAKRLPDALQRWS